nr:alpha-glucuronidase [Clostridia bacterium]
QYPAELRDRYSSLDTCPDELLLWFHRLRYDYVMRDGRTLIQRIYDDHFEGYEWVEEAEKKLSDLPLPAADKALVMERMNRQKKNAREWRDVVNSFFYRFSGIADEKGRPLYL